MPTTAQYLNELITQKKALANNITAKGVAASESEKFNTLVPKVAQIEELKGEEKVLDNITQYNNTPQSIVSIDYPENVSKKIDLQLSSKNLTTPQQVYKGAAAYSEEIYENKNCVRFSSSTTTKNSPIAFKPNTQYTVSFDVKTVLRSGQTTATADDVFRFFYSDGTSSGAANIYTNPVWIHKELTSIAGKTILYVGVTSYEYRSYSYVDIDSFQLEESSTATSYTPYITDFSTITVTRCGKNLFNINNVYTPLNTDTYEISDNKLKVYRNRVVVVGVVYRIHLPVGTQYTLYYDIEYGGTATGIYNCADSKIFNGSLNHVNYTGTVGDTGYLKLEFSRMGGDDDKLGWVTYSNIQVEFGSTVTSYELYQGQTYTSTSDGKVSGISSIYPTTNIFTDNAGALITVYQGTPGNSFIEVLPSEGKNGITKIQQPIVDSSVDFNIKPENIKKGITILGITGTYEPTA